MRCPDGGGLTALQRDQREQVRFQAAGMFAQGMRPPQVAERLRISQKPARAWHVQWRAGGIEALRSRGPSGPSSRFRPQWRTEPAVLLAQGPAAHGWVEDQRWTPARVATVIGRRRHVSLSVPQTWRLLRQMGFTAQVLPQPSAGRYPQCTGPPNATSRRWPPGSRKSGRWWNEGEGAGRLAVLRRRVRPGPASAQGPHLVSQGHDPGGEGHRQGRRAGVPGQCGVLPPRGAHPARVPDAGAPSRPQG
ncbi:DNA-binding protein [Streptomyces sp. NTH33]|nr:DNA-binding protein [Streptomyces sp. NTH33]